MKEFNLEERTFSFARDVRSLVNRLPKNVVNNEDCKQVTRSSGSVGANYIEANESLGKKDFVMKVKICRKEAKESNYWLRLLNTGLNSVFAEEINRLAQESKELMLIFSAIMRKSVEKNLNI